MTPKQKGEAVEAIILARLLRLGHSVSLPFGNNQRYDMILDDAGVLIRVQCKSGRIVNGSVVFKAYNTAGGGPKRDYVGDIDEFIVYCFENDGYYRVPISAVLNKKDVYLRIDPKGSNKNTIWAKDYIF